MKHTDRKKLTELEMFQKALSQINMVESAVPVHNGKIVKETDTYNKVEKLLASPEMEKSHKFLYDIDFDQLDDETIKKVDELFDLAVNQGIIDVETEEELDATSDVEEGPNEISSEGDVSEVLPSTKNVLNCYTCFYSAIKNGEIKTGECYSNAPTPEQAKVDAISKLTQIGFSDINIIAIETGDTDLANCDQFAHTVDKVEVPEEQITEADETVKTDVETDVPSEKDSEEEKEKSEKSEPNKEESPNRQPTHQEKVELFAKYFKTFKDLLIKMKQTSYKNFDLDGKAEFWKKMSEVWTEKYDPLDFMSPANIEKLENFEVRIK